MDSVEQKLDDKITKIEPGRFSRPTTVAEATAFLREIIDDLKHISQVHEAASILKAKQIEELAEAKANDEKEAHCAKRMADTLESLLFNDDMPKQTFSDFITKNFLVGEVGSTL